MPSHRIFRFQTGIRRRCVSSRRKVSPKRIGSQAQSTLTIHVTENSAVVVSVVGLFAFPCEYALSSHLRVFTNTSLRCVLALCVCGSLLGFGLADPREQISPTPVSLEKYGPGVVHSDTIMRVFNPKRNVLILSVILANIPQVLMSLIYFNYNALFTCIFLADEWDRFFGEKKKGLRVSTWPQGHRRQTYFLQLPYRYSLALAAFSGGLHWLISQSIFLIRVESYDDDDKFSNENTFSEWSPVGIILVMVAGAVLIASLVTSGYFRLRYGGIPVVGSCSAAIAAACHADPSERDSLATLPLTRGVVSGKDVEPGHCSFTSKDAEKPVEGCLYE